MSFGPLAEKPTVLALASYRIQSVLGSLYNSKRAPPYQIGAGNNTKAIVTRSKLKIEFDEQTKVIIVLTRGGNKIALDDAKTIMLFDETGNKLSVGRNRRAHGRRVRASPIWKSRYI